MPAKPSTPLWWPLGSTMTEVEPRVESGSIVFGADWPGLFLRGDDAFHYAMHLQHLLDVAAREPEPDLKLSLMVLRGLLTDLLSVDVRNTATPRQQLRSARDILVGTPTLRGPGPEEDDDVKLEIR